MGRRIQWEVRPIRGVFGWTVTRDGIEQARKLFKYSAVEFAVAECNYELDTRGWYSELMVKGRNGRYDEARTYGDDPPRTLG